VIGCPYRRDPVRGGVEGSSLAWDGDAFFHKIVDLDPMAMLAHQIVDLLDAREQHLISSLSNS
jgi:hypothetical protein